MCKMTIKKIYFIARQWLCMIESITMTFLCLLFALKLNIRPDDLQNLGLQQKKIVTQASACY